MSPRAFTRTAVATAGFATLALVAALGLNTRADDKDEKPRPPKPEYVPAERRAWTTSKVVGSPEPPPKYKSVRAYPNAKFDHPLLFVRCPGSTRVFVGEQAGVIYSLADAPDAKPEVFFHFRDNYAKLTQHPKAKGIGELYGLVFHPQFEKNRTCYVCYTLENKNSNDGFLPDTSRVSRFTVTDTDPPKLDPASEEIVITFQGGGHNGGDLHFGPDGMLYISTGDGRGPNPPDPLNTGQDCSDLLSSVLRIDVNSRDAGKNYAVPKDNPFVGVKDVRPPAPGQPAAGGGIRTEIWAFGFRNPWRMSFDRKTGDLWVGDVGWEQWEMVYKVAKGANYGWSITEGRNPVKPDQKLGLAPISPPTIEIPHTLGASVTGGYVYRGKKFPELDGAYIFGDWETRRIWAATFAADTSRMIEMRELVKPNVRVSAFGENNAGEIFYLDYDSGYVYTLDRNTGEAANAAFPAKLSDTGLFADVAKQTPADGVIAFYPNVRQWQDGATADYLVALPNESSVRFFDKPRKLPGQVFWHEFAAQFPAGAVLVKTLSLDVVTKNERAERRVETQILHFDGEDWRGYSYAWRADQSDADLVPSDGAEAAFAVPVSPVRGGPDGFKPVPTREHVWTFHSRAQCNSCHNAWSEYALAFTPRQLNRTPLFGGGAAPNQLVRLTHEGYVKRITADEKARPPFTDEEAAKAPKLAPTHAEEPLDARARSYLHVNCAHCHRFGGGGGQVVLELDVTKSLKDTGIFDVRPRQGDFGLPDARIVAPGDPFRSVLFYRMAKFGRGRMPHLGSEFPHAQGLNLIGEWIASLSDPPKKWDHSRPKAEDADDALKSFATAWPFARELAARGEVGGSQLLLSAAKLDRGLMHDLFDGHQPTDPKGRKLGASPRPAPILALTGDAKKGEALFFSKEMKCAVCHKVGDKGNAVGPDLGAIGKLRTRAELLDSLLNPSARVEPQYAAYNVRTKDEKTYTGLIAKRDDKQLVLLDAEGKKVEVAGDNVDSVRPSRLSLMPDGLLAGLTAHDAADLLEFLVQRK
jgi:putative heme-binding domain-containing protein